MASAAKRGDSIISASADTTMSPRRLRFKHRQVEPVEAVEKSGSVCYVAAAEHHNSLYAEPVAEAFDVVGLFDRNALECRLGTGVVQVDASNDFKARCSSRGKYTREFGFVCR